MSNLNKWLAMLAVIYGGLLISGYGVLIGSNQNVSGLGLQCKYLTARKVAIAQYVHGTNGIVGIADCPLFKKIDTVVK